MGFKLCVKLGVELRLYVAHSFVWLKQRDQGQQTQARRIAIDAMRVNQGLAQHLQSAADAQHGATLRGMAGNCRIEPLAAQPGQVTTGVLGAGQDDPVAGFERGQFDRTAHPLQAGTGDIFERLKFIEVAHARVSHHRHGALDRTGCRAAVVKNTVFFRQAMLPPHGQGGHGGHAGEVLQHVRCRRQQAGVTAELVEYKAFDQGAFFHRQQCPGAVEVGKRAAAVNVGHQQAGGAGVPCHAHVDDVAAGQVDLGG